MHLQEKNIYLKYTKDFPFIIKIKMKVMANFEKSHGLTWKEGKKIS